MKTIYITGIAGLLGYNLALLYLKRGWNVKGCDTLIGGMKRNLREIKDSVDFSYISILETERLKQHIKGSDVVVHCAALPYEGLSVFAPKLIVENIVGGTVSVASACIYNNVELLVNFSSMARYGNQTPPFTEDMPCKPADPYGLAKLQAEQHLEMLNSLHGLRYCTVVPHNVNGVGQRYIDPYRNVVSIMINRVMQDKSIIVYGDGTQKRSFSDVRDCCDAIERLIDTDRNICKQVYNIGPDKDEISINELAYTVFSECGKTPVIEYVPERPAEVKDAWCSSDKIKREFNYSTSFSNVETIREMIKWIEPAPFIYDTVKLEFTTAETPKTWTERLI
jgi:UDP-glucose 4-epimerase